MSDLKLFSVTNDTLDEVLVVADTEENAVILAKPIFQIEANILYPEDEHARLRTAYWKNITADCVFGDLREPVIGELKRYG